MRWVDGITHLMEMSWVSSRGWWWTGKPGMLQSMGSQRVTQLSDWTELRSSRYSFFSSLFSFSPPSLLFCFSFDRRRRLNQITWWNTVLGKLWGEQNHQDDLWKEEIEVREEQGWGTQLWRYVLPEGLAGLVRPVVLLATEFWETPLMLKIALLLTWVSLNFCFSQSSHLKSVIIVGNIFFE